MPGENDIYVYTSHVHFPKDPSDLLRLHAAQAFLSLPFFLRATMKLFALVSLFAAVYSPVVALWPQPRGLQTGNSTLKLAKNFQITISGWAPNDLHDAVTRTTQFLKKDRLGRLVVGRGSTDAKSFGSAKSLSKLTVAVEKGSPLNSIATEAQKALEDRNEEYTLTIPSDGSAATLTAKSTLGLLRGLTTFGQLWYEHDGTTYALETPLTIKDSPAYVCIQVSIAPSANVDRNSFSPTAASCLTPPGPCESEDPARILYD